MMNVDIEPQFSVRYSYINRYMASKNLIYVIYVTRLVVYPTHKKYSSALISRLSCQLRWLILKVANFTLSLFYICYNGGEAK